LAIIFQVTITAGYLLSPLVMRRLDTRPQFVVSLLASAVAQAGMAVSLILPYPPIALPSLIVAGLCYGLGVGPVPFVAMSSLFPQSYKTLGMGVGQVTRAFMVTAQLKAFPILTQLVGMEGIFLLHCTALLRGGLCPDCLARDAEQVHQRAGGNLCQEGGNKSLRVLLFY